MKQCFSIKLVVISVVLAAAVRNVSIVSGNDLVVVRYKKKPVLVEELTGVPYAGAVAAVDELSRDWTLELWPPLDGTRPPLRHGWKPKPGSPLVDYYRLGLQGVLWLHIRNLVYDRFLGEYPDRMGAYDSEKFSEFINVYAETRDDFTVMMAKELAANKSGADLEGAIERAFPKMNAKYAHLDFIEKERPYFILRSKCFLSQKKGVALSWMYGYLRAAIQDYHLRSEWRANRPKYIARIALETGECRALIFRNSLPSDHVESAVLAEELTTDAGSIAQAGLATARQTLARLGSSIHLGVIAGPAPVVFGSDLSRRIAVREIVEAAPGITVFLISQPQLNPALQKFYNSPEAELSSIQKPVIEAVVRPIVRDVLKEFDAAAFELPTEDEIIEGFGSLGIGDRLFGRDLPKYLKESAK